ncbi:MAG: aminoacetone oxidase family FAD-binding enzyme [Lachnospiraceae bacterium]|nr:aminoacetone oxidase family FAD-binding enzyme [Lachnospiraceae bacterium]
MKIGIIGCGAAGMMAAITATKNGHIVTVFESNDSAGKKLLATGNGKCNYTNFEMNESFYNNDGKALFNDVYNRFDINETLKFFEEIGIYPLNKNGYYYPRSEQAVSVVRCLREKINKLGVNVKYNSKVDRIIKNDKFIVCCNNNNFEFDRIIVCAGSNANPSTGSDGSGYGLAIKLGHFVKKPLPSLCGLKCSGDEFKYISGVRCHAKVTLFCDDLEIKSDEGELQLTDYGLSGIPVFQLSGEALRLLDAGGDIQINVDYIPEFSYEELTTVLCERINNLKDSKMNRLLDGLINSKVAENAIKTCGYNLDENIIKYNKDTLVSDLINSLKLKKYTVKGHRGFDNCQVCTGGVVCEEIKSTLESKIIEGLYFAGEILDVDGMCGGYNLQWAWSSGYVAGLLE